MISYILLIEVVFESTYNNHNNMFIFLQFDHLTFVRGIVRYKHIKIGTTDLTRRWNKKKNNTRNTKQILSAENDSLIWGQFTDIPSVLMWFINCSGFYERTGGFDLFSMIYCMQYDNLFLILFGDSLILIWNTKMNDWIIPFQI